MKILIVSETKASFSLLLTVLNLWFGYFPDVMTWYWLEKHHFSAIWTDIHFWRRLFCEKCINIGKKWVQRFVIITEPGGIWWSKWRLIIKNPLFSFHKRSIARILAAKKFKRHSNYFYHFFCDTLSEGGMIDPGASFYQ